MISKECSNQIVKTISIRHKNSRIRMCDFTITSKGRIILVDVERDRNGKKTTYSQDITEDVIDLCGFIKKK